MNSIVSNANQGQSVTSPGLKVFALALKILGISLWVTYLVYLPQPELFQSEAALKLAGLIEPGMIFYSLATAGAAFFVWGKLIGQIDRQGVSRQALLQASAFGMGMLALMRLGTTLFPHGPFQELLALPIGEFVMFSLIAIVLQRAARS